MSTSGADSSAQREAEREIRRILNERYSWKLEPAKVPLDDRATIEVDGLDKEQKVAVEIIARIGESSASRDKKMTSDALKLHLLSVCLGGGFRLIVAGCDKKFLSQFRVAHSKKWQAFALRQLGVELMHVELDPPALDRIRKAQESQGGANVRIRKLAQS